MDYPTALSEGLGVWDTMAGPYRIHTGLPAQLSKHKKCSTLTANQQTVGAELAVLDVSKASRLATYSQMLTKNPRFSKLHR